MSLPSTPTVVARGRRAVGAEERVAGDGAGDAGTRRSRRAWWIAVATALVLVVMVSFATRRTASDEPLAPDNPAPEGARATAQVLGEHGVDVTYVRTTASAISEAEAGSTLMILDPASLREEQLEALADVDADIVLVDIGGDIAGLTERVRTDGYATRAEHQASCADPDAEAAATITAGGALIQGDDVVGCFLEADGALYATWTEDDRTWRVISDGWMLSNEGLPVEGNAALVFRSLGAHDRLVWYLPDPDDTFGTEPASSQFPLPGPVVLQLVLIGLAVVLWRGRRLGPLVTEPLPVVVKATETTRGRGRLYRRAHAHAHAASALRAGLLARLAGRVGLPSHATPTEVVEILARATGRSPESIADLLYGPPPTTDVGLIALVNALDTLESEVQQV